MTICKFLRTIVLLCLAAVWLHSQEKYTGPIPPKPDVLYLMHATTLVETEVGQAREEKRKNDDKVTQSVCRAFHQFFGPPALEKL